MCVEALNSLIQLKEFFGTRVKVKAAIRCANCFPLHKELPPSFKLQIILAALILVIMYNLANDLTIPIIPLEKRIITKINCF